MSIPGPEASHWRSSVQHLIEDLSWLEAHAQQKPDGATQASRLRFAAALVRNSIQPFLNNGESNPLHVATVGGAGTGKSTIANFLVGEVVAESNPQAGFTRHPIAYASTNGPLPPSLQRGFLGPLRQLSEPRPSNLDEDVYQVRTLTPVPPADTVLPHFIIWDCPDLTTWQATGYVSRLIEVVALADLVVFVASDERYNDLEPSQFLHLILQAGKPVLVCLMKMKQENAQAILDHFRKEVLGPLPEANRVAACLPVPHLTPQELADPAGRAAPFRKPIIDHALRFADNPAETRRTVVRGAGDFLERFEEDLLSVAKEDLFAIRSWRDLVQVGRAEFESRYLREYLGGKQFPRFDEALVRLMDLLELPGVGQYISKTLWLVRTPWRLAKGFMNKLGSAAPRSNIPEEPVLNAALTGWVDFLRKETSRRSADHPLWQHVEKGLRGRLADEFRREYDKRLHEFHAGLLLEVETTARNIYEELEKSPFALNTLRGSKATLELGSIAATIMAGGLNIYDFVLVPLVAGVTQELVRLLGSQYVDMQRARTRERQQDLFGRTLAIPLAEWLAQWPATGGSDYERLQQALRRVPLAIDHLTRALRDRLEAGSASAPASG